MIWLALIPVFWIVNVDACQPVGGRPAGAIVLPLDEGNLLLSRFIMDDGRPAVHVCFMYNRGA